MQPNTTVAPRSSSWNVQNALRRTLSWLLDQYATVLSFLAFITIVIYAIQIADLQSQEGGAASLNLASHQRMLIERGALLALRLGNATSHAERQQIRQQLVDTVTLLDNIHGYLSEGSRLIRQEPRLLAEPGELAPELRALYFDNPEQLDRQIRNFMDAIHRLLSRKIDDPIPDEEGLKFIASGGSERLLDGLDKVTTFYQREVDFRLQNTQNLLTVSLAFSLAALLIGGLFMLRPLVMRLKDRVEPLRNLNRYKWRSPSMAGSRKSVAERSPTSITNWRNGVCECRTASERCGRPYVTRR